jgi:hypothetical protein
MKKGIYYIKQKVLFGYTNRQLNFLLREDQVQSLAKIIFTSESIFTPSSSMRMCCYTMR